MLGFRFPIYSVGHSPATIPGQMILDHPKDKSRDFYAAAKKRRSALLKCENSNYGKTDFEMPAVENIRCALVRPFRIPRSHAVKNFRERAIGAFRSLPRIGNAAPKACVLRSRERARVYETRPLRDRRRDLKPR